MRSYHRPIYQEPTTILSNLIDRLVKAGLRDELERLLSGVDGFEEVFNIGEYAERDPIKEQLANDFRLLFPIVVRTLGGLQVGDAIEGPLQSKLRDVFNDFQSLLASMMHSESSVIQDIEKLPQAASDRARKYQSRGPGTQRTAPVVEETVYTTEMPAALYRADANDYDLEDERASPIVLEAAQDVDKNMETEKLLQFFPDGSDAKYELSLGPDLLSQERDSDETDDDTEVIVLTEDANLVKNSLQSVEGSGPMAVLVKDPEMAALIPHIIEQLRMENVTPEEKATLAEIFDDLWPLMEAEATRKQ
ncbi:uncharacterized protein LOC128728801 [Anopheles nili]|uniref:uncharacterized protein LOC128728801 n=1 Tax=Anopheles nili TaxID=185578 RepID=UPI00237A4DE8|nr:uncharacterized protein LOC128728801 [Anopheles nili]